MKKFGTYLDLCTQVYELSKPTAPEDAYKFYRSYAEKVQGPILEPMCGTGRFLLPLIHDGLDVLGFDASPQMLGVLRRKAEEQDLTANVWEGFVEELDVSQKFGLIIIPSGSFGLITELTSVTVTLQTFYDHLTPNGILLFEVEIIDESYDNVGVRNESLWPREDGKTIRLRTLTHAPDDDVNRVICTYELLEGERIVQTEIEDIRIRRYPLSPTLEEILKKAGFREVRIFRAFDSTRKPDKSDRVIVYECRK